MERLSRIKGYSIGCLIIILAFVALSVLIPDRLNETVTWVAQKDFAGEIREVVRQGETRPDGLVEMTVDRIVVSEVSYQPVIILKQQDGELYLPIWIGLTEANAIAVSLEEIKVPRPLTPDLLCYIIDRMGASVDYIVINDIKDNTFYANIVLQANWRQLEIDARPSDAIAMALRVKSPIYATEAVLEKAGLPLYEEPEKYTASDLI
jgi:bifunctional DNase/RNase